MSRRSATSVALASACFLELDDLQCHVGLVNERPQHHCDEHARASLPPTAALGRTSPTTPSINERVAHLSRRLLTLFAARGRITLA